jgi:hypothetical protein
MQGAAMRIDVEWFDVLSQEPEAGLLTAPRSALLSDVLENAGYPYAELDVALYYSVFDPFCANEQALPFIVSDGPFRWRALYSEVTLEDLYRTIEPGDEPIRFHVGKPQAGGPDIDALAELWRQFYAVLATLDTFIGVGGGIAGVWAFLRTRRMQSEPPAELEDVSPGAVFSAVLSRERWAAAELAEMAGVSREDAIALLRLCRYRWDRRSRQYLRTDATESIMKQLAGIQQYEHL